MKKRIEADGAAERKWLAAAPKCFAKYRAQINGFNEDCLSLLMADLNAEIPDRQRQIISLLQTFGRRENFWTAYPSYEELPNDVLKTFGVRKVIEAYESSDRNHKTRKGLGRFLCSFAFKKSGRKYVNDISQEVIADLLKCFHAIGEKRGIEELNKRKKEKEKNSSE